MKRSRITFNANDALKYMVGPYYGWRGGTAKCEVLLEMGLVNARWVIMGCAMKGSHPRAEMRYIYRAPFVGGGDLPAIPATCGSDAGSGNSNEWNTYPYPSPSSAGKCYTESIVDTVTTSEVFPFRLPGSVLCDSMTGTE